MDLACCQSSSITFPDLRPHSIFILQQHDISHLESPASQLAMSDLYLSAKEAYVLRWATLILGTIQFWDFFEKRIMRKGRERRAAAANSLNAVNAADAADAMTAADAMNAVDAMNAADAMDAMNATRAMNDAEAANVVDTTDTTSALPAQPAPNTTDGEQTV